MNPIQYISNFLSEGFRGEGFLEEWDTGLQHAVMRDRLIGIPGTDAEQTER